MSNVIIEFSEQTLESSDGVRLEIAELEKSLGQKGVGLEIRGLPVNPAHAVAWWLAAWYGVKVVAAFVVDHDDTWDAVTTFIADVMDGHLQDGWVKVEVAPDGSVTHTTHKGNEYPEGSIVTVKDGKEEVRAPDSVQFTRDHFLKALREVLKALLA